MTSREKRLGRIHPWCTPQHTRSYSQLLSCLSPGGGGCHNEKENIDSQCQMCGFLGGFGCSESMCADYEQNIENSVVREISLGKGLEWIFWGGGEFICLAYLVRRLASKRLGVA